jgi:ATP-dependent DNA ligase
MKLRTKRSSGPKREPDSTMRPITLPYRLKARSCLIDGEAVACDEHGLAVFEWLRYRRAEVSVFLYAFDLLELDDFGASRWRPARAAGEPATRRPPGVRLNEHLEHEDGESSSATPASSGWRVSLSKRLGSIYRSGRSRDWLKFKSPTGPAVKREAEEDWGR